MAAHHDQRDHPEGDARLFVGRQASQQVDRVGMVRGLGGLAGQLGQRQQRQQRQHRDHRDVLEEQHREAGLAALAGQQVLLAQRLQHDGGGRHRQHAARRHAHRPRQPHQHGNARDGRDGEHHLQSPQPQQLPAQLPQLVRLQLQTHQEQHHHHAELGHVLDALGLLAHQAEDRTDQDAGDQVAQDGAQPQSLGKRHGDGRRSQVDECAEQQGGHAGSFGERARGRVPVGFDSSD